MNKTESENFKLAQAAMNDVNIFDTNVKTMEQLAQEKAKDTLNANIDNYTERLDKHAKLLEEYKRKFVDDMKGVELKPVYEGVLIKPFDVNPFQQIKKEGNLIVDTGGLVPEYKSHEDGSIHEEEQYVKVGIVVEVGPTVKYVREGDIVMWRKPSQLPIPFYKQGFVLVGEHSLVVTVNEGLTERFNEIENNGR